MLLVNDYEVVTVCNITYIPQVCNNNNKQNKVYCTVQYILYMQHRAQFNSMHMVPAAATRIM